MRNAPEEADLNAAIAKTLRLGTLLSTLIIAAGTLLVIMALPAGSPTTLQAVLSSSFGRPTLSPSALFGQILRGEPVGVLELGMILLVATPIARVAVSVYLFLKERDLLYVGITIAVLAMLLFAIFVIGPIEG